ncbi:MAG: hypothetical protein KatS3mg058_2341 [Roseiflexus sp.]|nr:MAG: hypothetical protein KatS3mg058_2341 [Roseiflexus sp.]
MHFIIYRQTGGINSALRSHQGTHRTCTSCLFPFVRFGSLAVKPVCSGLTHALCIGCDIIGISTPLAGFDRAVARNCHCQLQHM